MREADSAREVAAAGLAFDASPPTLFTTVRVSPGRSRHRNPGIGEWAVGGRKIELAGAISRARVVLMVVLKQHFPLC